MVTPPAPCNVNQKVALVHKTKLFWEKKKRFMETKSKVTFFPRMTALGSPWMTMYFVPPMNNPVGASVPGSAKSLLMPVISSGFN